MTLISLEHVLVQSLLIKGLLMYNPRISSQPTSAQNLETLELIMQTV